VVVVAILGGQRVLVGGAAGGVVGVSAAVGAGSRTNVAASARGPRAPSDGVAAGGDAHGGDATS
jgi:hypothetical protein